MDDAFFEEMPVWEQDGKTYARCGECLANDTCPIFLDDVLLRIMDYEDKCGGDLVKMLEAAIENLDDYGSGGVVNWIERAILRNRLWHEGEKEEFISARERPIREWMKEFDDYPSIVKAATLLARLKARSTYLDFKEGQEAD